MQKNKRRSFWVYGLGCLIGLSSFVLSQPVNAQDIISPEPIDESQTLPELPVAAEEHKEEPKAAPQPRPDSQMSTESDVVPPRLPELPREEEDKVLAAPTRSLDEYERIRRERMVEKNTPDWGHQVSYSPHPYQDTDLRVPHGNSESENISLYGLRISSEYFFVKRLGLLSAGFGLGLNGSRREKKFDDTWPAAFISAGPQLKYQFNYLANQILVPSVGVQYEWTRYAYRYSDAKIRGLRAMPRVDLALMFFLNPLERLAAGSLESSFGVKRTYLVATYSLLNDTSKKDVDLTESTWYFGLRFEH